MKPERNFLTALPFCETRYRIISSYHVSSSKVLEFQPFFSAQCSTFLTMMGNMFSHNLTLLMMLPTTFAKLLHDRIIACHYDNVSDDDLIYHHESQTSREKSLNSLSTFNR